jgi:hypothetical protein
MAQFLAFRVRKQAVDTARNMADMECYGRDISGASVQLSVTEVAAPIFKVFLGQLKRVQHRSLHSRNIGESSAQPRFRKLNPSHQNMSALYYALMRIPKNDR